MLSSVGAIVPIPFYFLAKRYPNSMFKVSKLEQCIT